MSGADDEDRDEGGEGRTVFQPDRSQLSMPPSSSAKRAGRRKSDAGDKPGEVAQNKGAKTGRGAKAAGGVAEISAPPAPRARASPRTPRREGAIPIGATLNNIYQVRRFIARGGMGEVYEGVNVNTDERVAIKVMLSHLASDPKVQAMFRKEARILTELAHPALVRYRVLAQEPDLDLFYIVTEFIEGVVLSEALATLSFTPEQLKALTRRLASGLAVAHAQGAIHRDMSPDNVLLAHGRLSDAKIIDFGIAKAIDPSQQTVVGDGFAGKLGYVAPEQFGDFDRRIGPWTDVYSLGLVILAVARGSAPDMGGTLVEAVDRRRSGPDLSASPDELRPVLGRMLAPDPKDRFQTMEEVIEALDRPSPPSVGERSASWADLYLKRRARPDVEAPGTRGSTAEPASLAKAPTRPSASPPKLVTKPPGLEAEAQADGAGIATRSGLPAKYMLLGGGAAAALVVALAVVALPKHAKTPTTTEVASTATAPGASMAELVRRKVEAAIPASPCSWLDVEAADGGAGAARIQLSGVAADPASVNGGMAKAVGSVRGGAVDIDTTRVLGADPAACALLDTLRARRESAPNSLPAVVPAQHTFEMATGVPGCRRGSWARSVLTITPRSLADDVSLFIVNPSGRVEQAFQSRQDLQSVRDRGLVEPIGAGFRYSVCRNEPGLTGLVLVTGRGPFDIGAAPRRGGWTPSEFASHFAGVAAARGWTTQAGWFRVVNAQRDLPEAEEAKAVQVNAPKLKTTEPASAATGVQAVAGNAAAPVAAAAALKDPKSNACWRANAKAYVYVGERSRSACVAEVFHGRCEVIYGRWGDVQMRRYVGELQAKKPGVFSGGWRKFAGSDCPAAEPPAPGAEQSASR